MLTDEQLIEGWQKAYATLSKLPFTRANEHALKAGRAAYEYFRPLVLAEVIKLMRDYAVEGGEPDRKEYPADTCEELIARLTAPEPKPDPAIEAVSNLMWKGRVVIRTERDLHGALHLGLVPTIVAEIVAAVDAARAKGE